MLRVISVLLTLGVSTSALAQDDIDDAGRKIQYKQRTEIDFEGVDVSGELVKPSGALLMDVKRSAFNPLIRFRENFNAEMEQSIDEVK
ncbi:MAG: hypothetical protein H6732_04580 [Alphaproteobacteria bacterium]|nr:hypothetical protein [Alphaproteobacteria bacterium]